MAPATEGYNSSVVGCRLCFFFSSRRRHTRFDCDWSSDVCSSDLYQVWSKDGRSIYFVRGRPATREMDLRRITPDGGEPEQLTHLNADIAYATPRSEERRVGKECRSRWSPYH